MMAPIDTTKIRKEGLSFDDDHPTRIRLVFLDRIFNGLFSTGALVYVLLIQMRFRVIKKIIPYSWIWVSLPPPIQRVAPHHTTLKAVITPSHHHPGHSLRHHNNNPLGRLHLLQRLLQRLLPPTHIPNRHHMGSLRLPLRQPPLLPVPATIVLCQAENGREGG